MLARSVGRQASVDFENIMFEGDEQNSKFRAGIPKRAAPGSVFDVHSTAGAFTDVTRTHGDGYAYHNDRGPMIF